jgi:hypothetical protein
VVCVAVCVEQRGEYQAQVINHLQISLSLQQQQQQQQEIQGQCAWLRLLGSDCVYVHAGSASSGLCQIGVCVLHKCEMPLLSLLSS